MTWKDSLKYSIIEALYERSCSMIGMAKTFPQSCGDAISADRSDAVVF